MRDIEDAAADGCREILHVDDLVITDAAREAAHDLGVAIVKPDPAKQAAAKPATPPPASAPPPTTTLSAAPPPDRTSTHLNYRHYCELLMPTADEKNKQLNTI